MSDYPKVRDPNLVGSYPAVVKAGGGYVWDDVLEYRVWCHPHDGAPDLFEGDDYFHVFETYEEALHYSQVNAGSEAPLALIVQEEYIDERESGNFVHVKEQRMAEWPVEFLSRPKRNENTIPNFLSPNAPPNRLDILRGLA
jgi:putative acetyltransferase